MVLELFSYPLAEIVLDDHDEDVDNFHSTFIDDTLLVPKSCEQDHENDT